MRLLALAIAISACAGAVSAPKPTPTAPVVTPTPEPTEDGVFGWWAIPDIKEAEDIRGGAIKLEPTRVTAVSGQNVAVRDCKTEVSGTRVTISGCGGGGELTYEGDRLTFVQQRFTATRAPSQRIGELEALVTRESAVCPKARECYRAAWPLLGREPNEQFDFGPGPTSNVCRRMRDDFVDQLKKAGKDIPAGCKP